MIHPRAAERARCPRVDGHYVPRRFLAIYLALRAADGWACYDRLCVDRLKHTSHARKLRELRELNREFDAAGRVIWDLVLTRQSAKGPENEFLYNRQPRPCPVAPRIALRCRRIPAGPPPSVRELLFRDLALATTAQVERDILSLLEA